MPSAVIVGAGVFGSSLARRLALDGWEVTLVEQESPGWDGSSSGGETRLVRYGHGSDRWYTRSAWRGRGPWGPMDPSPFGGCGLPRFASDAPGWGGGARALAPDRSVALGRLRPRLVRL